jgi:hypothetical protein
MLLRKRTTHGKSHEPVMRTYLYQTGAPVMRLSPAVLPRRTTTNGKYQDPVMRTDPYQAGAPVMRLAPVMRTDSYQTGAPVMGLAAVMRTDPYQTAAPVMRLALAMRTDSYRIGVPFRRRAQVVLPSGRYLQVKTDMLQGHSHSSCPMKCMTWIRRYWLPFQKTSDRKFCRHTRREAVPK